MQSTNAVEMAHARGIDPKRFRAALRRAGLNWHSHTGRWEVVLGTPEHADMIRVLATLSSGLASTRAMPASAVESPSVRSASDEAWIIDICDDVLKRKGLRQHRFPFLLGDPGPSGRSVALPVDAYYPDLNLVVEYHERQHSHRVSFFDDRKTISGISRGEQRRRYDDYRRTLLPQHGYALLILDYSEFDTASSGRLRRTARDRSIVASRLRDVVQRTDGGAYAPPEPNR
mgnify:FL=1